MGTPTERDVRIYQQLDPTLSSAAIRAGIAEAQRQGGLVETQDVIEYARAWMGRHASVVQGPVTAAMKVREVEDLAKLQPWVERTREQVFHTTTVPFPSASAAVAWVRQHEPQRRPSFTPAAREHYRRAQLELQQAATLTRRFWDVPKAPMPLRLGYLDGQQEHLIEVYLDSPLVPLARAVAEAATRTGYAEAHLTMLVLCGRRPPARRATAMIHEGVGVDGASRSVTITLPTVEVFNELQVRALMRRIRAGLHLRRRRSLQTRDAALLHLVKRRPRRAQEGLGAYWERVRLAWNQQPEADRGISTQWKMKRKVERVRARL
jgi:hypothetical protein